MAYDVVLPGGWGSSFWTGLVYAGAVAVGVDSEVHFMREEHTPPPPYLVPDLPAGKLYEELKSQESRQEYFSLPPDKRPNFIKLGVQFPFSFPWPKLIASLRSQPSFKGTHEKEIGMEFSSEVLQELGLPPARSDDADSILDCDECSVLRNSRYLNALDMLSCPSGSRRRIFRGLNSNETEISHGDGGVPEPVSGDSHSFKDCLLKPPLKEDVTALQETLTLMQRTSQLHLVRVQVTLIGKGSVEPLALICRPSASDLQHLKEALTGKQRPSLDEATCAVEPSRTDVNEDKRKQLKREHEKDQAKLHRLRKATRRRVCREHEVGNGSLHEALETALQHLDCQQQELINRKESYASTIESLWLMSPEAPMQQCSRLIVGCITDASFSRLRGCGVGQGYVPVGALLPICHQRLERYQQFPSRPEGGEGQAPRKKQKLDDGSAKCVEASCSAVCACEADEPCGHEDLDVDLPFIQERGIAVLVRNKNSLHYRFGLLTICCQQPPS